MKASDPRHVLRYWHGMSEEEYRRYKSMLDAGAQLNAIEVAEAQVIIERVQAWERENAA